MLTGLGCNKSNVVLLVNVKFRDHGKKKQHTVASLSSVVTSLCHREAGKKGKESAGERWAGEKEEVFPSSHRRPRAQEPLLLRRKLLHN